MDQSNMSAVIGQGAGGGPDPTQDNSVPQNAGPINVGITQAVPAPAATQQPTAPAPQQSRLSKIVSAVASTLSTGFAGIPDKGRPSFVTGLGEGARAEQAAQAQQAAIKFKHGV